MSTTDTSPAPAPHFSMADGGDARWFLGALLTIKADAAATGGRLGVMEHLAARGLGSPLHVHRREDEWFYVMEGEVTFWVGGRVVTAGPGDLAWLPRDVPHTFMVTSEQARFLLVVEPGGFEDFVRALSVPAERREIPPASDVPPDMERLVAIAAEHGVEILGPPGIPA